MLAALPLALALALAPATHLVIEPAANDDGHHLVITFTPSADKAAVSYQLYRTTHALDPALAPDAHADVWTLVKTLDAPAGDRSTYVDEVPDGGAAYSYAVRALAAAGDTTDEPSGYAFAGPARPASAWFDQKRTFLAAVIVGMLVLLFYFLQRAKKSGKAMYIRRIPGIDAMEEAIGRSTEMGRPVLFVPGIEEIQDIQTIAGLLILGHVAEVCARYDTDIRVTCAIPLTMVVAEDIVRTGFYNAGRPEAHRPQNVQFISSEQFAFTAGVNGIILREKPATCIYMGRFYAESLVLAEAGFVNKAIQIAGTAEITQLPFFIAACDYTIIGEELFAVSAYLSRDPRQLSTLKATDFMKLIIILIILVGTALNTAGVWNLGGWVSP